MNGIGIEVMMRARVNIVAPMVSEVSTIGHVKMKTLNRSSEPNLRLDTE